MDEKLSAYYTVGWELGWLSQLDHRGIPKNREYVRRLKATLALLSDVVKKGITILDAGCGVGIYDVNILRTFPDVSIYAFDISKIQLPQAQKLANKFNLGGRLQLFAADITKMPINAIYDIVLCTEVLEHIIDPTQVLGGLKGLGGKEARFIFSTPQIYNGLRQEGYFYKQVMPDGSEIHTQDVKKLVENFPHYEYYHALYNAQSFTRLLDENGFQVDIMIGVDFFIPPKIISGVTSSFQILLMRIQNKLFKVINFISSFFSPGLDRLLNQLFKNKYASTLIVLCKVITE